MKEKFLLFPVIPQHSEDPCDLLLLDMFLSQEEALPIHKVLQEPLHNKKQLVRCKQQDWKPFMLISVNFMCLVIWPWLYPKPAPVPALTSRSRTLLTAFEAVQGSFLAACSNGSKKLFSSLFAAVSSSTGCWKHVASMKNCIWLGVIKNEQQRERERERKTQRVPKTKTILLEKPIIMTFITEAVLRW